MRKQFVIGIDVGTGSARAGVFDLNGRARGYGAQPIRTWRPAPDFVEQSSEDIWRACGRAVKGALREAGVAGERIVGISFDATCSLVCLDQWCKPLSVSPTARKEQNVIVWMDHRAVGQAARINATRHKVLRYVGGVISPEMEPPKLLWMKENLPRTWSRAGGFFDLADFLTFQATGADVRSLCTTTCKWTYQAHLGGRQSAKRRGGHPLTLPSPPEGERGVSRISAGGDAGARTAARVPCPHPPQAGVGMSSRVRECLPPTAVAGKHGPPAGGVPPTVGRWDATFWHQIGLGELADEGFARIGVCVSPMGTAIGAGLTSEAARSLGLAAGTAVGVGAIDAHAGGLGLIGAPVDGDTFSPDTALRRLALIGGTSSCHMAVSPEARFIPGVWGPYYSAMVPGLWLTEGGQSATGALIDHCINSSAHAVALQREARAAGTTIYGLLNRRLAALAEAERATAPAGGGRHAALADGGRVTDGARLAALTTRLHVLGYHHGNRSPRANPHARGLTSGSTLNDTPDDLARLYLATIQAIAYGTRHIIEEMNRKGYAIDTVLACGGGTRNPVFLQQHADITGCRIHLPQEPEAVLLGTALLAGLAAGAHPDCLAAMAAMTRTGKTIEPQTQDRAYHDAKYRVFKQMYADQCRYDALMSVPAPGS